jgi:hypothetical protein
MLRDDFSQAGFYGRLFNTPGISASARLFEPCEQGDPTGQFITVPPVPPTNQQLLGSDSVNREQPKGKILAAIAQQKAVSHAHLNRL